ncbi:hypothetical protein [Phenylobacterium sp.]|uniref:hypothetical protein n=1 Tax=Phenylobacterium sp. TaxID=1871053 RepID=UPI001203AD74|nr:hypothetical protein [Phenylobacterium sp.]THD57458.1 MAG: hypothetical protein E8A49_22705 [Phenylobacterium sp.]
MLAHNDAAVLLRNHRWADERGRWTELVGALLSASHEIPNGKLHRLLRQLETLNLLDLSHWCATPESFAEAEHDALVAQTRVVLEDFGLDQKTALRASRIIHDAAHQLGKRYGGKIQLALREAGDEILEKFTRALNVSELTDAELRQALTMWLQNVLNLPISLKRPSFQRFCDANNLSAGQVLNGADELDLSVAALDDLIENWDARQRAKPAVRKTDDRRA